MDFHRGIGEFIEKHPDYLSPEIQRKLDRSLFAKTGPMRFEDPDDTAIKDVFYFMERWTNDRWNEGPYINYHKIHQFFNDPVNINLKEQYYDVIRPELRKLYPSGKIPVKREVPFESDHVTYTNAKGEEVRQPRQHNTFLVDIDDVVFTSAFREKELVVRTKDGELIATSPLTKGGFVEYDPEYKPSKAKSYRYPTSDNLGEEIQSLVTQIEKSLQEVGAGDFTENTIGRYARFSPRVLSQENIEVRNFKGNDDPRVKRLQYLVNLTKDPRYKDKEVIWDHAAHSDTYTGAAYEVLVSEIQDHVEDLFGDVFKMPKVQFGQYASPDRAQELRAMKDKIILSPLEGSAKPQWTN